MGLIERIGTWYAKRRLKKMDLPTVGWKKKRFRTALAALVVGILAVVAGETTIGGFLTENWELLIVVGAGIYGLFAATGAAKQERMLDQTRRDLTFAMADIANRAVNKRRGPAPVIDPVSGSPRARHPGDPVARDPGELG